MPNNNQLLAPFPDFEWPQNTNLSQPELLNKFKEYLDWKKSKMTSTRERDECILPFSSLEGLCAGLSGYWLYCKRTYAEWEFIHQLDHVINWSPDKVSAIAAGEPPKKQAFTDLAEWFVEQLSTGTNTKAPKLSDRDVQAALHWLSNNPPNSTNDHVPHLNGLNNLLNWAIKQLAIPNNTNKAKVKSLKHVLTWIKKKLSSDEDPVVEDFLNAIAFLQFDFTLRKSNQTDLTKSFWLLQEHADQEKNQSIEKIAAPEFEITFAFDFYMLKQLLEDVVKPHKMIYLTTMEHTIGLIYDGVNYYLYDSNYQHDPVKTENLEQITYNIFHDTFEMTDFEACLHLHLRVFDIERPNAIPVEYPDPNEYCAAYLQDTDIAAKIASNPATLKLIAQFNQFEILENLTRQGYKLEYDKKRPLLIYAILWKCTETLFWILANGIDLYSEYYVDLEDNNSTLSPMQCAAEGKNKEAATLLLAFGYEVKTSELDALYRHFTGQEIDEIQAHALALNKKMLHVPEEFALDKANGREIVMFLRDSKLKMEMGMKTSEIKLTNNGSKYAGVSALQQIARVFNGPSSDDIFDVAERMEIYDLLNFFKRTNFHYAGSKKISELMKAISKQVTSKPIEQHSKNDLLEIGVIWEDLELIINNNSKDNTKKNVVALATDTKEQIRKYFATNGINDFAEHLRGLLRDSPQQRCYLFFTPFKDGHTEAISFEKDIAPKLKFTPE